MWGRTGWDDEESSMEAYVLPYVKPIASENFLYDIMGCVCVHAYKFRLILDYPDEWKKKIWYIYAMEYSSAIKRKALSQL